MARLLQPIEIAKLFLVVRDQCCNADRRHPLAGHITIADVERYERYLEDYAKSKNRKNPVEVKKISKPKNKKKGK